MKKFLIIPLIFAALFLSGCTKTSTYQPTDMLQTNAPSNTKNNAYSEAPEILPEAERTGKKIVIVTNKGTIEFELYGEDAPLTVSNFMFLTNEGYYDGLTFHRVEPSISIIQGGDPLGLGSGGPGYTIEEEPPASNIDYKEGIVAMAKTAAPHSTGSQFFIMTADFDGFNPEYSIFGKVIKGIDVVKKIQVGDVMEKVTVEEL